MTWWLWILLIAALGTFLYSRRWAWWVTSVDDRHPRILMYHMICEIQPHHRYRGLRVSPALFEQQLKWLKEDGWTFVTMSELQERFSDLPPKTVALTFDDGFEDNYTAALPLLKKYEAPATLYLVIDRHDNDWQVNKKAHHNSGEVAREARLSDDQVKEMVSSGLIELGGHTIRHINLLKESAAVKQSEIQQCRQELQELFGQPITSFAYPYGLFTDEDVAIVQEAGFQNAVTTKESVVHEEDFFRLPRIKASGKDSMQNFKTRMRIGRRGY